MCRTCRGILRLTLKFRRDAQAFVITKGEKMRKLLAATTALVALPVLAQAQSLQPGGFYIGAEGGINWLLNTSSTSTVNVGGFAGGSGMVNINPNLGWTAGGMIGYDFIGPRVELEG